MGFGGVIYKVELRTNYLIQNMKTKGGQEGHDENVYLGQQNPKYATGYRAGFFVFFLA